MASVKFSNNQLKDLSLPPGQLIEVGGIRLHCYLRGPQIDSLKLPTVVIESGCGCSLLTYSWLQESLSETLQVCSYDRAGLGWSDASHQPRDALHIAAQLHALLNKAGINGPVVLVGHSIAGLYLRVYASRYPDNILGIVLLDPSHPNQKQVLSGTGFSPVARMKQRAMALYAMLGLAGLCQPTWALKINAMNYLPKWAQQQLLFLCRRPQTFITPLKESDSFDQSALQAQQCADLADIPLLVITAPAPDSQSIRADWPEHIKKWTNLHKDLLGLSRNSQHKTIEGAGHCTLITKRYYAEQVANEISQWVKRIT